MSDITGTPTVTNVFNQFDDQALLVSLVRLPGETNRELKQRIADVYTHRANTTYQGLIFGITRELGLSMYKPFRIYPRKTGNSFIAEEPIIEFDGPYVRLWRDYSNSVLEMEIDRAEQSGNAYLLHNLANYINQNSNYFLVDLVDDTVKYNRSMSILNQVSVREVLSEIIPNSKKFTLQYPGISTSDSGGMIILSTAFFSDRNTFKTRVDTVAAVNAPGTYYINRYTGDVVVFDTPIQNTTIRYQLIIDYWRPLASPVIIHNLQSDNVKRKMYEQVLADDGSTVDGVPTVYGASIINSLHSVYPLYYKK